MKIKDQNAISEFNLRAKWNLCGSIAYEGLRIGHNAVLALLFSPQTFGLIGSIFASTYLMVRLSDAGASNSLLPFFGDIDHCRQTFKAFFVKRLLFSLFITASLGAVISIILLGAMHRHIQIQQSEFFLCIMVLPPLIFSETIRSFLRQFLHLTGNSKQTVLADQATFCLYVGTCWPLLFYLPHLRTPFFVFILFLVDSILGLLILFILTTRYARTLPNLCENHNAQPDKKRLYKVRFYAWVMRACKELFSSNALTPLFAATVGLREAGLFYFAATLAVTMHAVMRSVIGYAGASFFVFARKSDISSREAFKVVSRKLANIIFVLLSFFACAYNDILKLTKTMAASSRLTIFFVLYFAIVVVEFTLFLYEQQYQLEEAGAQALQWRLFELILVYVTTRGFVFLQPVHTLSCILLAKTGTLIALALTGYRRWAIRPSIRIERKRILFLSIISLSLALLFKAFIYGFKLI